VATYLACDKRLAEHILANLPRLFEISMREGGTAAWIRSSIEYSVAQSASDHRRRRGSGYASEFNPAFKRESGVPPPFVQTMRC